MNRPVWKVGIVGCGKIAGGWDYPRYAGPTVTHAQAYHRHPAFHLVAAVDTDESRLERFQRAWGVLHGYRSLEEMQQHESLDVVSICSPDALHFPQAKRLLGSQARPRVLFVEKPICLDATELGCMMEMAKQAQVAVVVNHTRRFDPAHQQVAQLVKSGVLGALVEGRCTYYGGWIHNATHVVDTLRMLLAQEPEVVSADVSSPGRPGDPNLDVRLLMGDAHVVIEGFDEAYYQLFESELRFQCGRVRLLDFGSAIAIEQVEVNETGERILRPAPQPIQGLMSPIYHAVDAIAAYLRGHDCLRELGVDLESAAATMSVIWQAKEMAGVGPPPLNLPLAKGERTRCLPLGKGEIKRG
jgi:predicted dehydrogenase